MIRLACLLILLSTPALAQDLPRAMSCAGNIDPAGEVGTHVVEVRQFADGVVTMARVETSARMFAPEESFDVEAAITTDNDDDRMRFTTVLTGNGFGDSIYAPSAWLVDWSLRRIQGTRLAVADGSWTLNQSFTCTSITP